MANDSTAADRFPSIDPGTSVYDEDGDELGVVSGFTTDGFEVTASTDAGTGPERRTEDAASPTGEEPPGKEFGEGYLMWRCTECGEMGDLEEGLPGACPNCGAPKTALYSVEED